jgi:hypothetical protein
MNKPTLIFSLIGLALLSSFFAINTLNYTKIKQIQANIVRHPENLPKQSTAAYTTF